MTYTTNEPRDLLNSEQRALLKKNVSKNLTKLREAMEWTQSRLARETYISEPALSSYLKENSGRLPSLEYLVGLCTLPVFKNKGLNLTLDLLISNDFNPKKMLENRYARASDSPDTIRHKDFLGNYLCYFFDQSKPVNNNDYKASRDLRYGVIALYPVCENLSGEYEMRVLSSFFKKEEIEEARSLKKQLDEIEVRNLEIWERAQTVEDAFCDAGKSVYMGRTSFSEHHIFISIQNDTHKDNALIILNLPPKKRETAYIGGLGSVASVAGGQKHMPTAQKILLSQYDLLCSEEQIVDALSMTSAQISQKKEAEELCYFCRKLYSNDQAVNMLEEADKAALIQRRMDQLVQNYIAKNLCCVGTVSQEEDQKVYEMIKESKT